MLRQQYRARWHAVEHRGAAPHVLAETVEAPARQRDRPPGSVFLCDSNLLNGAAIPQSGLCNAAWPVQQVFSKRCYVTDINADAWVSSNHRPMGFAEFVIVIASIMALNPLAMLSTFLIGFGVGQFVMGPLSDRFGRRPVLLGGMAVYCFASLLAIAAQSFETLLLARALQGLGTSATRVIATSIVRDCYAGR